MGVMHFAGGLPETKCGGGSTISYTTSIRSVIPELIEELGITSILDAPCGDCNWISTVDLGVKYTGMDYDDEHIKAARSKMTGEFICGDIVADKLPVADLMMCRDFFQHITNDQITTVLGKIGAKWLLATSHMNSMNENLSRAGGFRPVNLCKAPFNLPDTIREFDDGDGRILGLWKWA